MWRSRGVVRSAMPLVAAIAASSTAAAKSLAFDRIASKRPSDHRSRHVRSMVGAGACASGASSLIGALVTASFAGMRAADGSRGLTAKGA